MSDIAAPRLLGRTGLTVGPVSVGAAAWGLRSPVHGVVVTEDEVGSVLRRASGTVIDVIDTSNNYGDGESERRIGRALRESGLHESFIVQTKLDRDPDTGSFDGDRMRRSLDESLARLSITRVPILYLHDPEHITFAEAIAPGGPVDALIRIKHEGLAGAIGISGGPTRLLSRFVDTGIFDALITHNRYTLVDHSADELISHAADAGMGVMNAAVYGGGVLAEWPRTTDRYHYASASPVLLAAIDAMSTACEAFGVRLIDAALQHSVRDERIHSTICGMVNASHVDATIASLGVQIPAELWTELDRLRPGREWWIDD